MEFALNCIVLVRGLESVCVWVCVSLLHQVIIPLDQQVFRQLRVDEEGWREMVAFESGLVVSCCVALSAARGVWGFLCSSCVGCAGIFRFSLPGFKNPWLIFPQSSAFIDCLCGHDPLCLFFGQHLLLVFPPVC